MRSLHKIATILALLFCLQPLTSSAFPTQDSKEGGTITGRVLLDNKPAPGVVVMATHLIGDPARLSEQILKPPTPLKALTDADGRYRLQAVPAGSYNVSAGAPTSVTTESGSAKAVEVTDGAAVEDIDFSLARGGIITGKITDSEGRPVIAEEVSLKLVDSSKPGRPSWSPSGRMYVTDDRGIYRIYGLAPGRYTVSAGSSSDAFTKLFSKRPKRVQTYYPGVTEETKSKPVEVIAGAETSGIDIKLGVSDKGFTIRGSVLAIETGAPIAGAMIGYSAQRKESTADQVSTDDSFDMSGSITTTDAKGEFRFDAVASGQYTLELASMGAMTGASAAFYADPVTFEIQSRDIDKLEIKVHLGASINGVVIFEGVDATNPSDISTTLMLLAMVTDAQMKIAMPSAGKVAPDGSFRIGGLKAGKATIRSVPTPSAKLSVIRVEREGIAQPDGIDIQPNEQITGVRVIVVPSTCVIRARVTVVGGTLPAGSEISVWVRALNGDPMASRRTSPVDSQGNFVIEDLPPGDYEVEATVNMRGAEGNHRVSAKQFVTVTNASPAQTALVLDLSVKGSDK